MLSENNPAVTVCVITHSKRLSSFNKMLTYLEKAALRYEGNTSLLVGNNSGVTYRETVCKALTDSNLGKALAWKVVDSPENNIAVGRNTVLDNAVTDWVAFIDDDEYPSDLWLRTLIETMQEYNCAIVAGPIIPVFPKNTVNWVSKVDIHNASDLVTGSKLDFAASGNFLVHLPSTNGARFNPEFGKTGGSDTDYFIRLTSKPKPLEIVWAEEAVVYEEIPADRATRIYTMKRFLSQGSNFKRIMIKNGKVKSIPLFYLKAITVCIISLCVAVPLVLAGSESAGNWIKRGISNLGKLYDPSSDLYW